MINEYETHSTLNPKLWIDNEMQPKVRIGFIKIAKAFYNFLETNAPILDIVIIGSSANYNWTEHSDIDLHVIISYSEVGKNMLLVKNYMQTKKSVWGMNYPLTFKDMPIELYAQDSNEVLNSTVGIYSLLTNKWINKPSADIISIDDDAIEQKVKPFKFEIDKLDATDSHIEYKIQNLLKRLVHLRKSGLDAEGEYSIENMAYKNLRNTGYIERLKQLEKQVAVGQLRMEMMLDKHPTQVITMTKPTSNHHDHVAKVLIMHVSGQSKLEPTGWDDVVSKMNGVTDPMGQWKHPGKCTMIPTTDGAITMKNVPHPVLGIDDCGDCQMMHPENQYQFAGRNVFEIPHTAQYQTLIMQIQNAIKNGSKYGK